MQEDHIFVFPTGSDITELIFKKTLKGRLLRIAYKKAKIIIYAGAYMHPYIQKLNLDNAIFIPPPWDFKKFHPIQDLRSTYNCVNSSRSVDFFLIFLATTTKVFLLK